MTQSTSGGPRVRHVAAPLAARAATCADYPNQAAAVIFPGKLANPWMAGTMFAKEAAEHYFVVGYAAALAAAAAIAALTSTAVRNRRAMLTLAVLSAIALPFLLPKMLERYFFLADVLSLVLAQSLRGRMATFIAVAIQAASLLSLLTYIYWFYTPSPTLIGALFSTAAKPANPFMMQSLALARAIQEHSPAGGQLCSLANADSGRLLQSVSFTLGPDHTVSID